MSAAESGSGKPQQLPQNIGHRGYKAAFPENSMAAFHGAVVAGAHALETDLHLSRDGVVVLSHVSSQPASQTLYGAPSTLFGCGCSPSERRV